ncbi:hypothetical protein [Oryza sativa Japonica Group]|uniref:Uncharacterized protein n=1 Tax=Oryza sativa subsp. japonica TaxID=39947 RepID=Q5VNX3_ORYSJ|nr:hypothetical protein [Oryza sativa Japonica Group]BAD68862.1 hypothetical protein [Oryza sativa Japonica Group]
MEAAAPASHAAASSRAAASGPHRLGEPGGHLADRADLRRLLVTAMFAVGHLADRADLRRLLGAAMVASGATPAARRSLLPRRAQPRLLPRRRGRQRSRPVRLVAMRRRRRRELVRSRVAAATASRTCALRARESPPPSAVASRIRALRARELPWPSSSVVAASKVKARGGGSK